MAKFEENPKMLTKYVDDLFGIIKKSAIEKTLAVLNNFHSQIKFTIEVEENEKLPYLDTLVIRKGNILKIDWYQKPTSSGRIVNYYSSQAKNIILNTAKNLVHRVLSISDEEFHKENIKKVRNILKNNSFPENIIRTLAKSNKKTTHNEDQAPKIYKSMVYIPKLSERFEKANIYNKEKYKTAPKTTNTLRKLFTNTKSKIEKSDMSNLIYRIKCTGKDNNNCNQEYVGTTKNKLKTRLAGHKSDFKNRDKNSIQKTALSAHCAEKQHTPDLDNVDILQTEKNNNKRYILEMLHINQIPQEKRINSKSDIESCAAKSYRHITNKRKQSH